MLLATNAYSAKGPLPANFPDTRFNHNKAKTGSETALIANFEEQDTISGDLALQACRPNGLDANGHISAST